MRVRSVLPAGRRSAQACRTWEPACRGGGRVPTEGMRKPHPLLPAPTTSSKTRDRLPLRCCAPAVAEAREVERRLLRGGRAGRHHRTHAAGHGAGKPRLRMHGLGDFAAGHGARPVRLRLFPAAGVGLGRGPLDFAAKRSLSALGRRVFCHSAGSPTSDNIRVVARYTSCAISSPSPNSPRAMQDIQLTLRGTFCTHRHCRHAPPPSPEPPQSVCQVYPTYAGWRC